MKRKKLPIVVLMGLTTAFLFVMALLNCRLSLGPAWQWVQGNFTFSHFTTRTGDRYADEIVGKEHFVNLNGWFAGALDQTVCNEVVKLKNGMLSSFTARSDNTERARRAIEFKDFLNREGIAYLYVCAPCKNDLQKELLPEGIEDYHNENADDLLARLQAGGAATLDLRGDLSATPELVNRYFFKTDHHWNFAAAMQGVRRISDKLQEMFPERKMDFSNLDPSKWQSHELKRWFLGSRGKRVGPYFGGLDDVVYYTPNFSMNISHVNRVRGRFYKGDFEAACISDVYLRKPSYAYNLYTGGGYVLTQYFNADAPNDLRIVLLSDSFGAAGSAFLATLFQEVDMIVLAQSSLAGTADYIRSKHPDIVIQLLYPMSTETDEYFSFDTEDALARGTELRLTSLLPNQIEVREDARFVSIPVKLEANQSYRLCFDDAIPTSDATQAVLIRLYDAAKKKTIDAYVFDLEYARAHGGFSWPFTTGDEVSDALEIRFYAKPSNDTGSTAAVYRNVRLYAVGG